MSERIRIHMVGNAHLDPVWLWQWQEGFQEVKATFRSALDRMKEYSDFVFTSSQAAVYEWIERNEPAMFEEIRLRIREGRWVLCGGWWIQADCNLPSGESFVRQGLYGQLYFQEKFGVMARSGYNVDSFGHHAMLPQILRKSGMDRYVFMRPGEYEKHLDANLFWWEADDGSRVLTCRIPYYTHIVCGELENALEGALQGLNEASPRTQMLFYGVGNHGGGPTKRNIELIKQLNRTRGGAGYESGDETGIETELLLSTPDRYFEEVLEGKEPIPVLRDELQMHAKGCYSVQSDVKRWNRRAEQLIVTSEKFAALAARHSGQPYPERMDRAWKSILFNQFHDILPGSSIEPVYADDARDWYGEANAASSRALNDALQSISWKVNIAAEDGMKPIVVFNPHSWTSRVNVELDFGHFGYGREYHSLAPGDILIDEEGRQVALQSIRPLSTTVWRQRLSFMVELPAFGYRTFRVVDGTGWEQETFPTVKADDASLENEALRLVIDPETGWIASLFDKRSGVETFRGPAAQPAVIADDSDTWSHDIERFDQEIGVFRAKRVRRIEHGPVKSVIRVDSEYGDSKLTQQFTMYPGRAEVEVHVTVDWRERYKMLKLRFPVNVQADHTTYEIPYGTIKRPNDGKEYPALGWFDQSGEVVGGSGLEYGLSVLNDGKYSFDSTDHVMSMTVLRSPIYAWDRSFQPEEDVEYDFMDQGIQRFAYVLLPHEGGWRSAGTVKRAAELNQRPITVIETYHDGPLPQRDSFIDVDRDNVIVSAIKPAEDGGGDLIVRCYETNGEAASDVAISLPAWRRTIRASFGANEIKTFRIPHDESLPVVETDMLERTM